MGKNIYDLINEIDTDIESYDQQELTRLEEKRIMKRFKDTVANKPEARNNYKKYISAAAVAVIAFGTVGAIPTMATTNPTMYQIATALGIEKDLTPYETIVGKEITKDGLTMRINQVIINNDELIVSVTTTSETSIKDTYEASIGQVYINGKHINMGASAEFGLEDDYTGHTLVTFPLDEIYEGDLDIKLELGTPLKDLKRVPKWKYEFKANGDALRIDTQKIVLDQTIETKNGNTIKLGMYEGNAVSHAIRFESTVSLNGDWIEIKGVDEKGNEVKFERAPLTHNTSGELVVYGENKEIVDNAKTLTLGLYINDELVGNTFEINK